MIKHIVFWKLKDSAGGRSAVENAAEIKSRLESLQGLVPGMIEIEVGVDLSRTEASADVALYSVFSDMVALGEYQAHPAHLDVASFINEVRALRTVVDYEI